VPGQSRLASMADKLPTVCALEYIGRTMAPPILPANRWRMRARSLHRRSRTGCGTCTRKSIVRHKGRRSAALNIRDNII
jgi:hypothetical protein